MDPGPRGSTLRRSAQRDSEGSSGAFNIENLRSICNNNDDRLEALLQLMDEHYRAFRNELLSSIGESDQLHLQRLGHTIAGCAAQMQFKTLASAAKSLETSTGLDRDIAVDEVVQLIDECLAQVEHHLLANNTPKSDRPH